MIYWLLFWTFFKVSCLSVGGAYSAIPLIREEILSLEWVAEEELIDFIALSESTPGPLMINLATYVGTTQAGLLGALIATFGIVLPAFVLFYLIAKFGHKLFTGVWIEAIMNGLKPVLMGVILATGVDMTVTVMQNTQHQVEWKAIAIGAIILTAMIGFKKCFKKSLSPIKCILLSAVLGVVMF